MKIKHYNIFNGTSKVLDWESLRNDESEAHYFLPYSVEKYLKKVDRSEPSKNTAAIILEMKKLDICKIFSIGSGIASQEYQLKKFSGLPVTVTDYNSSILRLKSFDIFDNCIQLDAFKDILPVDKNSLVIFPRIDTEFDDQQLKMIFQKCSNAGVRFIWVIPAELLDVKIIAAELKILVLSILRNKPRVFCGYARSKSAFKKIWSEYYKLLLEFDVDNKSFLLRAINE